MTVVVPGGPPCAGCCSHSAWVPTLQIDKRDTDREEKLTHRLVKWIPCSHPGQIQELNPSLLTPTQVSHPLNRLPSYLFPGCIPTSAFGLQRAKGFWTPVHMKFQARIVCTSTFENALISLSVFYLIRKQKQLAVRSMANYTMNNKSKSQLKQIIWRKKPQGWKMSASHVCMTILKNQKQL